MQVGPGQRAIHHFRAQRFDELPGPIKHLGLDGSLNGRRALDSNAVPHGTDPIEGDAPPWIAYLCSGNVALGIEHELSGTADCGYRRKRLSRKRFPQEARQADVSAVRRLVD